MKRRELVGLIVGAVGIAAAVGVVALATGARSAEAAPERAPDPGAVPVLVELFTSEGCSSCPPADAVLARLERTQPVAGAAIVPLAVHVDYWDGLGWPDPFATNAGTARQGTYRTLGAGLYTPQAVVDGQVEVVGSRGAALEQAVAEAARRPHAKVTVTARRSTSGELEVEARAGALPAGAAADAELVVALVQRAARVTVPRGENAGRTLEHTAIARGLRVLGVVPKEGAVLRGALGVPAGLGAREVSVVAFVQERASRRVLGAARSAPLEP